MENKSVILVVMFFLVFAIYLYSFELFVEKNFLWIFPIFFYIVFFVVRDSKEGKKELDKMLLPREGKMKFEWRLFLF